MNQRLLFLIHSLSMGGAERVAVTLANYWVNKGYAVAVATLSSNDSDFYALDPRIERIALDVAKPSRHPIAAVLNNLRTLRAVRRLLKQWRPQVTIALMTMSISAWQAGDYLGRKSGVNAFIHPCYRWGASGACCVGWLMGGLITWWR
jgi:UDP-N-acetylglucosamine:LPS N-acetylglucosamine transferase